VVAALSTLSTLREAAVVPVILSAAALRRFAVEDEALAWLRVDSVVSKVTLGIPAFPLPNQCDGTHGDSHCALLESCQVERQWEGTGSIVGGC